MPGPLIDPKSDAVYRIRNVDSGLYLERNKAGAPQMRPDYVTNQRQHWRFIKVSGGPPAAYTIQNPYTGSNAVTSLYLNLALTPITWAVGEILPGSTWYHNFLFDNQNSEGNAIYLLANQNPRANQQSVIGTTPESSANRFVGLTSVQINRNAVPNQDFNHQWELLEVPLSALPGGPVPGFPPGLQQNVGYKIGTPGFPSATSPQYLNLWPTGVGAMIIWGVTYPYSSQFKLEPRGNGIVISGVYAGQQFYLGVNTGLVVTTDNNGAYVWTIRRENGGGYTISTGDINNFSLAGRQNAVNTSTSLTLVPRNIIGDATQIWSFVP